MQRTSLESDTNQGDGIYRKTKKYTRIGDNNELLLSNSNESKTDLDSLDTNHNEINLSPALENESETIDNILNILDRQLEHIDELKENHNHRIHTPTRNHSRNESSSGVAWDIPNFDYLIENRSSDCGADSQASTKRVSRTTRNFILNNYIESCIKDSGRDCDCHYHLPGECDQFFNELSVSDQARSGHSESAGSISLQELIYTGSAHKQQVNSGFAGGAPGESNSEWLNRANSVTSPDANSVVGVYSCCCSGTQHDAIDDSAKRTTHYLIQLSPPNRCSERQHCEPLQLRPTETRGLFIDRESVQTLKCCETITNDRCGILSSALNNRAIFCSKSESELCQAAYCRHQAESGSTNESSGSLDLVHETRSLPELNLESGQIPIRGCRCDCHRFDNSTEVTPRRTPALNISAHDDDDDDKDHGSSGGEDEEEDLDLLFETRSALDCVEESPSNNELSILSTLNHRERDKITLESQLYCSLTNDSATSRQESPSRSFVEQPYSPEDFSQNSDFSIWECEKFASHLSRGTTGGKSYSPHSYENCLRPAPGVNQHESLIWSALHKMGSDENLACKNCHSLSNREATSTGPSLRNKSQELETGVAHDTCGQKLEEAHASNHCDHSRNNLITPTDNGSIPKLKLDNDESKSRNESTESHNTDCKPAAHLKVDCKRETCSLRDSNVIVSQGEKDPSMSMKATKDLIKLSIPSLSALQYLPGQIDVKPTRMADQSIRQKMTDNSHGGANMPISSSRISNIEQIDSGEAKSENSTIETRKHDHSCLLHRLCLCNCMTPRDLKDVKENAPDELRDLSSSHNSSKQHPAMTRGAPSSSDSPELQEDRSCHKHRRASSSSACVSVDLEIARGVVSRREHDEISAKRVTKELSAAAKDATGPKQRQWSEEGQGTARQEKCKKPSPTFLSVLKPASKAHDKHIARTCSSNRKSLSRDTVRERLRGRHSTQAKELESNLERGLPLVRSDGLGSIGDLLASGRSSSASGTNSDLCSPLSRSNCRSDGSSSYRSGRLSADILSDESEFAGQRALHKPRHEKHSVHVCSGCKVQSSATTNHKSRLRSFRKLLSPNKLCTSTSSISERVESESDNHQADSSGSKSFLSRSFIRLSKKKSQKQLENCEDGLDKRGSDCASPDNSTSNSQPDTYADSVNSLEEIGLASSLPFDINRELLIYKPESKKSTRLLKAPEVVLSRVEYQKTDECPRCSSSDMTAPNGHSPGDHRHFVGEGNANVRDENARYRPSGQMSFASDSQSSDYQNHGPFSLPGSPKSSRRKIQRSRNSRLSQSPIPFRSPASESTKIEDGLKVCSTEHFEKHIGNIKEDQIEAQKRLFTIWINYHSPNFIRRDLFDELKDGIKLIGLLATLTHDRELTDKYKQLNLDKQTYVNRLVLSPAGQMRNLANVSFAIGYLKANLGMQLVNLNPMDIVSGKANVILGLCWNIIMHFQLDRDLLGSSDANSQSGSTISSLTPRSMKEERKSNYQNISSKRRQSGECSVSDLAYVRSRLLAHINKRFNLKLTNRTSSLVDGDVMLAMIKQMISPADRLDQSRLSSWNEMNDDEKLDLCFDLANQYFKVPKLISASDLRRQIINENNTKTLLVYLSMLLKSNPRNCSTDQMLELRQVDESLKEFSSDVKSSTTNHGSTSNFDEILSTKEGILSAIESISASDKFHIHNLQSTLSKVNLIERAIQKLGSDQLDEIAQSRFDRFKKQAEQVDSLILWINKADKLFELKQQSSKDLAKAIEEYRNFFDVSKLPSVDEALCPTLERQYRECIATAKQRLLSMEQAMKNWISYEQACQDIMTWLKTAEEKLINSLRPESANRGYQSELTPEHDTDPVCQYSDRLADLVEYFELEPIDINDLGNANFSFTTNSFHDEVSNSSLNNSLSSSLLSLGSNTSRFSALTSSKRAKYNHLFDMFELRCRLLAAMLEPDQKEALLVSVKAIRSRLKYVIDHKLPQVLSEIRLSIDRCEMSIKEQDELCDGFNEEIREKALDYVLDDLGSMNRMSSPESHNDDAEISDVSSNQHKSPVETKLVKKKTKTKPRNRKVKKANASTKTLVKASATSPCFGNDDEENTPLHKALWKKICRASKMTLSLNIVLLICLAGICIIPLIQNDACCELNETPISPDGIAMNQRPT